MKNFVSMVQRAFVPTRDPDMETTFEKNLLLFVNLPEKVKLSQFREYFIKPLAMDYALGISTFQIAKTFNVKPLENIPTTTLTEVDTSTIMKIILSYLDCEIVEFDPRLLVFYIENEKYPSLKLCFESIPYNYKGIAIIELMKFLESFYPKIAKGLIKELVKRMDESCTGLVSYTNLSYF